jgi:hypothetical protein
MPGVQQYKAHSALFIIWATKQFWIFIYCWLILSGVFQDFVRRMFEIEGGNYEKRTSG